MFSTDSFVVNWDISHYLIASCIALIFVSVATWIPARRASRIEPAKIIRRQFNDSSCSKLISSWFAKSGRSSILFSEHRSVIDVLREFLLRQKGERLPRLLVRLVVVRAPFFI